MSEYKGLRKLLVIVLTVSTIGCVLLLAAKFGGKKPPVEAPGTQRVEQNGGSSKLPPAANKEGTYEQAMAVINEADLKKDLYYLASKELEGRMSGKEGNLKARDYIEYLFRSFDLQTMRQEFYVGRFNPGPKNETGSDKSENIIAWIDGNDPALKNEIVVVGAHMDHIGYGPKASQAPSRREVHPGADDNASGTVALLRIARAFSMMKGKVKRTTVFMAFSGEEMGLIGSKYYCEHPLFPKGSPSMQKHVAMINMDMIGYLRKGEFLASFDHETSSPDLDKLISELNGKYSFARSISGRGAGGSDHAPFYNKRVPVVCLHTGMHREYHTPDDTADRINYKGLEQVARYAFELSWRCATGDSRPAFDNAKFVRMSEDHDHGYKDVPFNRKD